MSTAIYQKLLAKKTPPQNPGQVYKIMKINKNSTTKPVPMSLNEFVEKNTNKLAYLMAKMEFNTGNEPDNDKIISHEYYKYCRKLHHKTRANSNKTKK
jgi:hypothetical protein